MTMNVDLLALPANGFQHAPGLAAPFIDEPGGIGACQAHVDDRTRTAHDQIRPGEAP
jgi:hypothetical protein